MNPTSPNLHQHVPYTHKTGKPAIGCAHTSDGNTQHIQNYKIKSEKSQND